jgi:hypothetical protein
VLSFFGWENKVFFPVSPSEMYLVIFDEKGKSPKKTSNVKPGDGTVSPRLRWRVSSTFPPPPPSNALIDLQHEDCQAQDKVATFFAKKSKFCAKRVNQK